jgi:poly-gamma-glutamate synthase PgsB/CapB
MTRFQPSSARILLEQGMSRFQRQLHGHLISRALDKFSEFQAQSEREERMTTAGSPPHAANWQMDLGCVQDRRRPDNAVTRWLLEFLRSEVHRLLDELTSLNARHAEFRRNYARAVDEDESRRMLLDYAAELGATWWQRIGDRRALKRWLDEDALNDRYLRRRGELELQLIFTLERLGRIVGELAGKMGRPSEIAELWERLGVEPLVRAALQYSGDRRVRVAAMQCLATSLSDVPPETAGLLVEDVTTIQIQRLCTDPNADTWLQCAALDVLNKIDIELFARVLEQRLVCPASGDDLFVRRHCLRRLTEHAHYFSHNDTLWNQVIQDPSPAVRQQLAATLWQLPPQSAWPYLERLVQQDKCGQVRAAALVESLNAVVAAMAPRPDPLPARPGEGTVQKPRSARRAEVMGTDTCQAMCRQREYRLRFLRLLADRLVADDGAFCQRVAMHVAVQWLQNWTTGDVDSREVVEMEQLFAQRILPAICRIQLEGSDVPVRRWAAAAAEQVWVLLDPTARRMHTQLLPLVRSLPRGRSCRLPAGLLRGVDPDTLGRTLAVLTQDDFGIEVVRGLWGFRLQKQPRFGFRCWRAWSEFWRPATDKRQAYRHTVGRIAQGTIRSPSRIMGELSATKVPGEPLVIAADGTWRPFLPLLDDFVSAFNQNLIVPRTTRLYSSEGVTEIRVTCNPLRKLGAAGRLLTRFPALAELRNWNPGSPQTPDKYLQVMQQTGFRVTFRPHAGRSADSSVTQFFPALLVLSGPSALARFGDVVRSYAYYFNSAFENNLTQLVEFTAVALILFLGRHAVSNLRIWWARKRVPLCVGGWGTRGKSGTERLKAALITGTGHGLVSKTTGCEAMFIQSPACGEPLEIPLYRPGDKATIWEQSNLLRLAARMRPSVFLWECMGLTPDYVDVLQQQWMHDDLATITNTYPDHEDVQGPSGMDVATTITVFVPTRSRLLTTEQQMFPLVRDRCRQRRTTVRQITWLESGLITDDLLDRFPYREHPDNIALVAALADELGLSYDYAVKAMADHLIPDLGVLKTHPIAHVQACSLEFTNGMSANERFGCLGNWKRLEYDRHDPVKQPAVFISTVVNNRADRVARSRVFASVLVNDLQADRHFLIGGNLKGLQGFIWESWAEYERTVSLCREGGHWDMGYARQTLQQLAERFRVPTTDDQIQRALAPMLAAAANVTPEAADTLAGQLRASPEACSERLQALGIAEPVIQRLSRHLQSMLQAHSQWCELRTAIDHTRPADSTDRLDARLHQVLRDWFTRKLVVIENYDATGEEIIQRIVDETPPGFLNRVMGIQNIKGTGLDFVYRFHAWDTCHEACELLTSSDQDARSTALAMLESMPEYGLLCQQRLQQTLEQLRQAHPPLPASQQVPLESIRSRLTESVQASLQGQQRQGDRAERTTHPLLSWLIARVEEWMDVQDAVRRRKKADQIYRDLQRERIGRQRAVEEIRKLNKRQKGGWLEGRLLNHHA